MRGFGTLDIVIGKFRSENNCSIDYRGWDVGMSRENTHVLKVQYQSALANEVRLDDVVDSQILRKG
jgi:hypothetical protein